jgi:methyltransferase
MIAAAYAIVGAVVLARLIELFLSARNTSALLARGGRQCEDGAYPFIVALHVCWLVALVIFLPRPFAFRWYFLAAFGLAAAARVWVMASLGPWFTTRIVTLDGETLVSHGPYRFMSHPNYAVVVAEMALLPLAYGEYGVAVSFSLANAALLLWRIRDENRALAARRTISARPARNG